MAGGPSHLETFDPKPLLERARRPAAAGGVRRGEVSVRPNATPGCSARPARSRRHGQSGIEVSDLFPHTARLHRRHRRDPLVPRRHGRPLGGAVRAVQRPHRARLSQHGLVGRSMAWARRATRCRPTSCMPDPDGALEAGQPMYTNGFLPAVYQPTMFRPRRAAGAQSRPAAGRLARPAARDGRADPRAERSGDSTPDDEELAARIASYDLAFRMQTEAPEVFDLSRRDAGDARPVRRRRASRRTTTAAAACWPGGWSSKGVRFIVVVSGGGPGNMQWDAHNDIEENHLRMAGADRPARRGAA